MTTKFTDEQVEAARRARNSHDFVGHGKCRCGSGGFTSIGHGQHQARAALVAALGAAPQAETPQCGPCRRGQHGCCDGNEYLRCDCGHVTPVLPSITVDEAALIREAKAEAWTEGLSAAIDAEIQDRGYGNTQYPENPYRKAVES